MQTDSTIHRPVSRWRIAQSKMRSALNPSPAKLISRWRIIIIMASATTSARELNWPARAASLPNSAELFEYTGYIDRRQGRWDEATRNLERALDLDPRNFFTLAQVALLYHWQHRYADEARTYDRSLKIVPGHPLTRMLRAALIVDWRADH